MNKLFSFIISFMLLWSLASCGSHRNAVKTATPIPAQPSSPVVASSNSQTPAPSVISQIASTYGAWSTVKIGGSVAFGGAVSFSSSMQMRMARDKSIYISVRPLGLVEAAKLVITGDTLIVVDKLHKRYLCENVKIITNGVPADVSTLQDIFLGRAFVLGEGTLSGALAKQVALSDLNGGHLLQPKKQYKGFSYHFKFDAEHKILSVEVAPAGTPTASTYAVKYSNVGMTMAGLVPGKIDVSTKLNNKNVTLKLEYSNFSWNEPLKIDTSLPKKYTKMSVANLSGMFGN